MNVLTVPELAAQGIVCGEWTLALPTGWGRRVVDDFDLVPVPRSPQWLAGVANVQGGIVAVVDLGTYLSPDRSEPSEPRQGRLLVGSCVLDGSEEHLALLFSGLPRQLRYRREAVADDTALPPRLRALCTGTARDGNGRLFHELDSARLISSLLDELQ